MCSRWRGRGYWVPTHDAGGCKCFCAIPHERNLPRSRAAIPRRNSMCPSQRVTALIFRVRAEVGDVLR